ncbi:MAG: hypothetical protein AOA65_1851 [Candidatus Bathyarchaeota archaeon BA1]|nr:MAG: hypothetical protein AOA65_1851 [Candidatus Bathyarchaeota archaeon BA1]
MSESELEEVLFKYVDMYFKGLKALRDLENKIPELESREEKVKAFIDYFKGLKRLRELESEVGRIAETLAGISNWGWPHIARANRLKLVHVQIRLSAVYPFGSSSHEETRRAHIWLGPLWPPFLYPLS